MFFQVKTLNVSVRLNVFNNYWPLLPIYTLRMKTVISAETLIPISQTTRCHREGYSTYLEHRSRIKQ
jgi:hypothetical protein